MERLRSRGGDGKEKYNWKEHTGGFWNVGERSETKNSVRGKTWP